MLRVLVMVSLSNSKVKRTGTTKTTHSPNCLPRTRYPIPIPTPTPPPTTTPPSAPSPCPYKPPTPPSSPRPTAPSPATSCTQASGALATPSFGRRHGILASQLPLGLSLTSPTPTTSCRCPANKRRPRKIQHLEAQCPSHRVSGAPGLHSSDA